MIEAFVVNIGAGVFLAVAAWLIFQVLQPRYLAWRYNAPRLDGTWSFHDSVTEGTTSVGTAEIRQAGELLSANVTRTISRNGKPLSRAFHFKGSVRDGQVLLAFHEPVSGGFIRGNVTLKLSSNLKALTGITAYLDRDMGDVVSHPICFRRS